MTDPKADASEGREEIKARWARLRDELAGELKELRVDAAEGLDKLDARIQEWRDRTTVDEKATEVWDDVEAKARSVWDDLKTEFRRRKAPPAEAAPVEREGDAGGAGKE